VIGNGSSLLCCASAQLWILLLQSVCVSTYPNNVNGFGRRGGSMHSYSSFLHSDFVQNDEGVGPSYAMDHT
jgi:hypothetical protein